MKVSLASVKRAWRDGGYADFWLQIRTKADLAVVERILDQVADAEGPEGASVQVGTETPVGYAMMLDGIRDDDHLKAWLSDLASRLEIKDVSGTLQGLTPSHYPGWIYPGPASPRLPPCPSMVASWTSDFEDAARRPDRGRGWLVDPSATARISDVSAAWAREGGPDIVLRRDIFTFRVIDQSIIAETLRRGVSAAGAAGALCSLDRERRGRYVALSVPADTELQVLGVSLEWRDSIDDLRSVARALADLADQIFIRPAFPLAAGWGRLREVQRLPGLSSSDVYDNRHLLSGYVPDAHGIQVLRDAHLAKAHDLSRWNVTDLGHGRHLVEAPDLEPWYSQPLPDPETVVRAREDFGAMILT
ncbi:MAG TPA: hypothetical protein VGM93_10410, partial [Acidimicrobiales bacterium]